MLQKLETNKQLSYIPQNIQKNVYHDHGRYQTFSDAIFYHKGIGYPVNQNPDSPLRSNILAVMIDELIAMTNLYSRVFFSRFDLHLPCSTDPAEGNRYISKLFKKLHSDLKHKRFDNNGRPNPIENFAHAWVRELEQAEQAHYHCWIALPNYKIQSLGNVDYGTGKVITDIWTGITGGGKTLVQFPKKTHKYPNTSYVIKRGDFESLQDPVYWLSYMAKERGKFQTGKGSRSFSTSKLRNRTLNS